MPRSGRTSTCSSTPPGSRSSRAPCSGSGSGSGAPESRAELAFALLTAGLTAGLLAEAAVYGSAVHERYTFYVVPLLGIAFARYAQRGWPYRLRHAVLAAGLVAGATRLPLTILGERGESHSSVLIAVAWLRIHLGQSGDASLVALAVAALAAGAAVVGAARPRAGVALVLAVAALVSGATLAGSTYFVGRAADAVRAELVPADPSWVDHAGLGRASLVTAAGVDTSATHLELVFNRSLDRLLVLPGGASPDVFAASKLRVGANGLLSAGGSPVRGPVVVDGDRSLVELQGEEPAAVGRTWKLYRGSGPHRLGLYFHGRWATGWVSPLARLEVWAPPGRRLQGTLELPLSLPRVAPSAVVTVSVPGRPAQRVTVPSGGRATVSLPLCGVTSLHAGLSFSKALLVGHDYAGARAARPVFRPGAGCAPRSRD